LLGENADAEASALHGYPPLLGDNVDVEASEKCKRFLVGVDGGDTAALDGVPGFMGLRRLSP